MKTKNSFFNTGKSIIWVFLVALFLRVAFVLSYPQSAPDTGVYDKIALNLVDGLGYTVEGSTANITRPPLYPFFLAGIYSIFGHSFTAVRLIQAIIDSITVIFVYKLGKTISGEKRVGIISALLACFYPELVVPTAYILTETLSTFLLTVSIWFLTESIKNKKINMILGAGFFIGLATLCRPITLAFPVFLFMGLVILYHRMKSWMVLWICFSMTMAITIAPWTLRNFITFNKFIPVGVGAGSNLWTGSYIPWDGDYNFQDTTDWQKIKEGLDEIEADKKLKEEAFKNIRNAPGIYFLLCGKKLIRFWAGIPGSKKVIADKPLIKILLYIIHYCIIIFFVIGLCNPFMRNRERWIPVMIVLYFTFLHVILFSVPRYRILIIPEVLIFAGMGIVKMLNVKESN